ncbi:hypothetical protein HRH25_20465 [Flavisolibacter sp. BT320]|nr:hypothetical protein [Flavisolibacter longurius]
MRKTGNSYQLYRDGKPYFIKGAGGSSYLSRVAAYGGNSIRTWGTRDGQKVLDSAQHYGLTVLMGLPVTPERHGFNYDDTTAVRRQFERVKVEVLKYKDHPALLAWGIGNELNLQYKNPKVWDAVNDIAKMIQEVDPLHPPTTVLAGINKREVDYIKENCPAIAILSINTYGGLATLPRQVEAVGWAGPYMVTEWGPTGHWEGLQTAWNMPIEETSSEKAAVYKSRYQYSVERDREKCLGSYVFLWGQKQERTPTWYGLFTESGEESEVMDVMYYLWTGTWPANKAPHLYSLQLDKKKATDNIYVAAGSRYEALAVVTDPDGDKLSYRWELLHEPTKVGEGGDHEDRPSVVKGAVQDAGNGKASVQAPATEGAYRLFVYATDGNGNVATANVPFFVQKKG